MRQHLRKITVLTCFFLVIISCRKELVPWFDQNTPAQAAEIIETAPAKLIAVKSSISGRVGGYYVALPARYELTTKKYPMLVFIHGAGQFGNGKSDLYKVLNEPIPKLFKENRFPPNFKVGNENFSFIMFAPQFQGYPSLDQVKFFIDSVQKTYRVDSSRIYVAGLSIGGVITADLAAEYPNKFAAIVPMGGESRPGTGVPAKTKRIANGGLPVWVFHNQGDFVFPIAEARTFVSLINSYFPLVRAKLTEPTTAGHDAWTLASEPTYKENNLNIYEWMLQYRRR